ncbi:MAG: hypothetical protein JNK61_11015 [Bacteroidia bacterium]|nr:hypothetical protein [Bacteroidia bacterium]HQV00114.1 hypothetical protein [Bacteroidia bacterium]
MKKTLLLFACWFCISNATAQNFEMGIAPGFTNYFGDLGNNEFFQNTSTRPAVALTLRNFLGKSKISTNHYKSFDMEARFSWQRIAYDETKPINGRQGDDLRNYLRGLSFRTDMFSLESRVTYTLYKNKKQPLHIQKSCMYFFTGLALVYGNPKADLFNGSIDLNNRYYFWSDGSVRNAPESSGTGEIIERDGTYETELNDWHTEGESQKTGIGKNGFLSCTNVAVPLGLGFRFGVSKKINVGFEVAYYKMFTDAIDNVSDRYVYQTELENYFPNDINQQQLAAYISDPTGNGTNGYPGPQTSQRGNPSKNDSYTCISLELSYKFDFLAKKVFGMR